MAPDVSTRRASAHRQALRAASRIAFTFAGLGCLGCLEAAPGVDETAPDDESDGALDAALDPTPDAAAERDALIDFVAEDARVDVEGDGALVDDTDAEASDAEASDAEASDAALADATPNDDTRAGCAQLRDDVDAWVACCDAINWDFNRDPACAAWGPPMPPAMPSAMPSATPAMPAEVA
ncbi:MAG: hypothetical protein R3F65_14385 [bacterium]